MKVLTTLTCIVLLAGCATEASGILPEPMRVAMQQQATAVLFTDDVGEIRYVWGLFNAPSVNRPDHAVRYKDSWDAGPTITAVHSQELAKLGMQTKSVYELVDSLDVARLTTAGRDNRGKNYEIEPLVSPALAQALIEKGQRYLFWVTWSGLRYFHTGLPTTPVEQISSSYWLFDLNTRMLIWSGGLADIRDSSFKYSEAKAQLEDNGFAGFKRLVEHRYRMAYQPGEDSVPWLLGLAGKK
jgi:hypothetical protein